MSVKVIMLTSTCAALWARRCVPVISQNDKFRGPDLSHLGRETSLATDSKASTATAQILHGFKEHVTQTWHLSSPFKLIRLQIA